MRAARQAIGAISGLTALTGLTAGLEPGGSRWPYRDLRDGDEP
jgi:hypothetical protein